MFQNKEQKIYFWIAIIVMVVLGAVTFLQPASLSFVSKKTPVNTQEQANEEQKAYNELLASVKTNQEASQELFKQLVDEKQVKLQVQSELGINQKVMVPDVPSGALNISDDTGKDAISGYFEKTLSLVLDYSKTNQDFSKNLFDTATSGQVQQGMHLTENLITNLYSIPVPKEALNYHKSLILIYQSYLNVLTQGQQFATGAEVNWSKIYLDYSIIDAKIAASNASFNTLIDKYKLAQDLQTFFTSSSAHSYLAKSAQAQIFPGLGGVVIIKDIPATIFQAIREALARAFARFAISALDKLVSSIESNFAIASQLYYSESLGQVYSTEYLKKYVTNPLDQEIIKQLIPEFFCIPENKEQLKAVFSAKAKEYLGYDLNTIDPSDPDFFIKLSHSGDIFASPLGQELYYRQLAGKTQAEASAAATKEVLSPGIKSPRDLVNNQITKTLASIFNVQAAAINGTIQLGTNNPESVVSQIVAGVIDSLLNKFVFSGAVLQEQAVCLSIPITKPVIPSTGTNYDYTPPIFDPNEYGVDPSSVPIR